MTSLKEKSSTSFFRSLFRFKKPFKQNSEQVLTDFLYAIEELKRRQKDPNLRKKIEEYLHGDIPLHFKESPILYLARHVATPNFETLRFLHLVDSFDFPTYIGQDIKDKFVPNNQLKKALGKIQIANGISKKNNVYHEQISHVCIIDFNKSNGKEFHTIETNWGENLVDFHTRLFSTLCRQPVKIVDDSGWIDRQARGDLTEHYKKFLALFLVHGILFEDLELEDKNELHFLETVLIPAFKFIEKKFGYRPLIVQLTPTSIESSKFWLSYPKEILNSIPPINKDYQQRG